jgi:hypothetical protein
MIENTDLIIDTCNAKANFSQKVVCTKVYSLNQDNALYDYIKKYLK